MKKLALILGFVLALSLSSSAGPAQGLTPASSHSDLSLPPAASGNYALVAWTELGMHCMDGKDYSIFSVLPPYNTIHAQLMKKGEPPTLITTGVNISYQAVTDTHQSINTVSAPKTNFWTWAKTLFLQDVTPEMGLAGYPTQGTKPVLMTYNATESYWEAVGIPTVPYDNKGRFNPFPMAKIVATDLTGKVLAATSVVLSVSDEMSCKNCHASGSDPYAEPATGWVYNSDPLKDPKLNILKRHDDHFIISQTYLDQLKAAGWNYQSSLYQTAVSGTPVLCAACHSDFALSLPGLQGINPLTNDMHTLHGPQLNWPSTTQTLDQAKDDLSGCYVCHPGPKTQCKRGAMKNVLCSDCHGNTSHLGDPLRAGWLDLPACQMCHNTSTRYNSAFDNNGKWRTTTDLTFATNPDVPLPGKDLYRFSAGHGKVFCSACHGSPHAEYPTAQSNDNVYPNVEQKYVAKITECTVCHTTQMTPTPNLGPHGIHAIGQAWVNVHPDYVDQHGYSSCAYCHGSNYTGLFLSQAKVSRTFTVENGQKKTFNAGHNFNCYDCHNGPNGG